MTDISSDKQCQELHKDMLLSRLLTSKLTVTDSYRELLAGLEWLSEGGVIVSVHISGFDGGGEDIQWTMMTMTRRFPNTHICTFLQGLAHFAIVVPRTSSRELGQFFTIHGKDTLFFGVSSFAPRLLEDAHFAWAQAQEALAYRFYGKNVFLHDQLKDGRDIPLADLEGLGFDRILSQQDTKDIYPACQKLRQFLTTEPLIYPERTKQQIVSLILTLLEQHDRGDINIPLKEMAVAMFTDINHLDALIACVHAILFEACIAKQESANNNNVIESCLAYLEENLDASLQEASERFCFHPNYFSSLIKKRTGMSYSQYIHNLRMKRARALLHDTKMLVQEVADMAGYHDPRYFSRVFRQDTGVSPAQYRRQNAARDAKGNNKP